MHNFCKTLKQAQAFTEPWFIAHFSLLPQHATCPMEALQLCCLDQLHSPLHFCLPTLYSSSCIPPWALSILTAAHVF